MTPKRRFLKSLHEGGTVYEACLAAEVTREDAYAWRAEDADFDRAWSVATAQFIATIQRRANTTTT